MDIAFNCPTCGNQFQVAGDMAGRRGQCTCGSVFVIPAAARPAAAVAVAAAPVATRKAAPAAVAAAPVAARPAPPQAPAQRGRPLWVHLLPFVVLTLGCLGVGLHDWLLKDQEATPVATIQYEEPDPIDPDPILAVRFHDQDLGNFSVGKTGSLKPKGDQERPSDHIEVIWAPSMRFGLVMLKERNKLLTRWENGLTNNTCVRLDGKEWLFGETPWRAKNAKDAGKVFFQEICHGHWKEKERDVPLGSDKTGRPRQGRKSVWYCDEEKVQITQHVEIVAGAQSRRLDTCLVYYVMENQDNRPHNVGLRFMLDTYIGSNDGVPFTIPGQKSLTDTMAEFNSPQEVPDFIQALENENLASPGTVALVQFKVGQGLEAPGRVTLGAWPNSRLREFHRNAAETFTLWDVPVDKIKALDPPDSAVVMYWNEKELKAGETRRIGFAYGLGSVASSGDATGKMALSVSGSFEPNGIFTLTAYVNKPVTDQTLTLTLPDGFTLVDGKSMQTVPPIPPNQSNQNSPVSWRIQAPAKTGNFPLKVRSSTGIVQTQPVSIKKATTGIFD